MIESIPFPRSGPARAARAGFTLLELVAVIGVIAIMSAIVVGGYGGILKALSRETGVDAVRRAVNLARQQACVDGQVTYVWVTGIDTFVLVRKGGSISDVGGNSQGQRDYWYGPKLDRKVENAGGGKAKWVYDRYADLTDYQIVVPDIAASDVKAMFDNMRGALVFDMRTGALANMIVPPQYDGDMDAWVFGVDKTLLDNDDFEPGAEYGWLTLPEQSLPKGYAFSKSFTDEGTYDATTAPRVKFEPDGTTGCGEFVVFETDTGKGKKLEIKRDGSLESTDVDVDVSE
jgi:prepilin-type N-terminal cleavage/methylation domain-containing protein